MTGVLVTAVAITLALFLVVHATLLVSLAARRPRYRALIALVAPPLAPYWAWRRDHRTRVYLWLASLTLYAAGIVALGR